MLSLTTLARQGTTALMEAARRKNELVTELLLVPSRIPSASESESDGESGKEQGSGHAYVNYSNINGDTALHTACMCGQLRNAELLICAGADLQRVNTDGRTPLDVCLYEEDYFIVQVASFCPGVNADCVINSFVLQAAAKAHRNV
jgi:ankyrin repeat protein